MRDNYDDQLSVATYCAPYKARRTRLIIRNELSLTPTAIHSATDHQAIFISCNFTVFESAEQPEHRKRHPNPLNFRKFRHPLSD